MLKLFAPNNILEKLSCIMCKSHLSVFPIYTNADGSGGVCGRCTVNDDKFIHDRAYENIAQFLIFPCSNKVNGCKENLTPHFLEEHEKSCIYQNVNCPTKNYSKCQWQGLHTGLTKHFQDNHSRLLLKSGNFELNYVNSSKEIALLPHDNQLFVVKKETDSGKEHFICSVQHLRYGDSPQNYKYFLRLVSGDTVYSCKFPEKSTFSDDNITKVDASYVKEKLNDPATIMVNIELSKTDKEDFKECDIVIKKDSNINWELLADLECPICFDSMLAPIYQCADGHSICADCKVQITECPLCRKAVKDTRNFALEKMTQYLIYPCKYYKIGCAYSCKPSEIKKHEESCMYGPYKCPLNEVEKCEWKSNSSQIVEHIETTHDAFMLKSDRVNITFDKDNTNVCFYLIKFSGKAFKVHYKYEDKKFYWSVQFVGSAAECGNFQFEIDIVDLSRNKFRRYAKGPCVPIAASDKSFDDSGKYLTMTLEQIEPLITTSFSYKIRIVKD